MNTTEHVTNKGQGTTRIPNKLVDEKSPYLLQHAYNPVKWYPWGNEAFEKAKSENKPIFLSIGYSTCHWCHVMEAESFEDDEVSALLNANFIPVKVDREERPDVDGIYMAVCQALTGQGGWPLTIFMTPDKKPFYAGTYFPKNARYQSYGMMELLTEIARQWKENRSALVSSGEKITDAMKEYHRQSDVGADITQELIEKGFAYFEKSFDARYGGFGGAPKFPSAHNLLFLMKYAVLEQNDRALAMTEKTLTAMYRGGIFDHIGFGFSRYSTDKLWLAPHFEKMGYDNALLILAYLEAFRLTSKTFYGDIAAKTIAYVFQELSAENGGFFCAQDADSDGEEGKYYTFTRQELDAILGEQSSYFCAYFGVTEKGNFEGRNILNLLENSRFDQKDERIDYLRKTVYDYRLRRTVLRRDDKILTSWNALMITALSKAYGAFGDISYLERAEKCVSLIEKKLSDGSRLFVRFRDGETKGMGHIDDYAYYVWALLSLHEITFDIQYLSMAEHYAAGMLEHFFDFSNGGFYFYAGDNEQLLYRPKENYDNAMPSGNSVALLVLNRLFKLTGNKAWEDALQKQIFYLGGVLKEAPAGHSFALLAGMEVRNASKELVCVLEDEKELSSLLPALQGAALHNVAVLVKTRENGQALSKVAPFTEEYAVKDGETTFYLCQNQTCLPPFHGLSRLMEELKRKG